MGKIIGTKLSNFTNGQKELDALYDSLDTASVPTHDQALLQAASLSSYHTIAQDKSGGVEVAEMLPGLNALRLKVKEVQTQQHFCRPSVRS